MNELTIINHNGVDVIDSRIVAEATDKQHKDLLRDIRGYIAIMQENAAPKSGEGAERRIAPGDFFIGSTYLDANKQTRPCFLLTKKGCDMVANKMTGEKGVLFTAAYITAFEQMREHIQSGNQLPDTTKQTRAEAMLNNSRARVASVWTKIASIVGIPAYQQICASYASNALAGREVIPLPQAQEHYYTATEIGEMFGLSKQQIGKIANRHNLKTSEYGIVVWDKSPYSPKQVESFRYNEKAVQQFREILGG